MTARPTLLLALLAALLAALSLVHVAECSGGDLGRGFGDKYDWHTLDEGMRKISETGTPGMVVIHKSWCGACKNLGPMFGSSVDIQREAASFVMINVYDDEEPKVKDFAPDGGYIPRILFLDSHGRVRPEIINEGGNAKYQYFYGAPDQIVRGMKRALNTPEKPHEIPKEQPQQGSSQASAANKENEHHQDL